MHRVFVIFQTINRFQTLTRCVIFAAKSHIIRESLVVNPTKRARGQRWTEHDEDEKQIANQKL